jgi:hypothetical protein
MEYSVTLVRGSSERPPSAATDSGRNDDSAFEPPSPLDNAGADTSGHASALAFARPSMGGQVPFYVSVRGGRWVGGH